MDQRQTTPTARSTRGRNTRRAGIVLMAVIGLGLLAGCDSPSGNNLEAFVAGKLGATSPTCNMAQASSNPVSGGTIDVYTGTCTSAGGKVYQVASSYSSATHSAQVGVTAPAGAPQAGYTYSCKFPNYSSTSNSTCIL